MQDAARSWPGAKWWRVDVHTHTPASYDFRPAGEPTEESLRSWLTAAERSGLDAVFVTDHNTAAAIDALQAVRNDLGTSIVVFPAVEVTAADGVHVIVVFDPETAGATEVNDFLSRARIPHTERGTMTARSTNSVEHLLALVEELGLVAIAAHANCAAGLLHGAGQQRLQSLRHTGLWAAELVPDDSIGEGDLGEEQARAWLDGPNSEVGRTIPIVHGSDAHREAQLGRRFTWFKMTAPTLEGIRLALLDGAASVRPGGPSLPDPNTEVGNSTIEGITIRGAKYIGRVDPFELRCSPWLTSLIGSRGTGKSTIVDLLRAAFGRADELPNNGDYSLRGAYDRRIQTTQVADGAGLLTETAEVVIEVRQREERFKISWSPTSGTKGGTISRWEEGAWVDSGAAARSLFPVRIFGQKQLFEMATAPDSLLEILDDAPEVDAQRFREGIEAAEHAYLSHLAAARTADTKAAPLESRRTDLDRVRQKLRLFEDDENAETLRKYGELRAHQGAWQTALEESVRQLAELSAGADALFETSDAHVDEIATANEQVDVDTTISSRVPKPLAEARTKHLATMRECADTIQLATNRAMQKLAELVVGAEVREWAGLFEQGQADYQRVTSALASEGVSNTSAHPVLVEEAEKLEAEMVELEAHLESARQSRATAAEELARYRKLRRELRESRKRYAAEVSSDRVTLDVRAAEPTDRRENLLRETIGCGDRFGNDIDRLVGKLGAENEDYSRVDQLVTELREAHDGAEDLNAHDKRFYTALRRIAPEAIDRLALYTPRDTVEVSYHDGNRWKAIAHASPGQRTAALLAFVLAHGKEPIVLDQPEDDLDPKLVYQLLVDRLRQCKRDRQIIVVTHSSNVVVHGDAELVVSLDSRGGQTRCQCIGGLQETSVRDEVCRVMEGGHEAFEKRFRRILGSSSASRAR